ncbi:hypothetical protein [Ilyobacter polytropus]|jgi:hypothetical protein|uniref:hypothetical protein n=1 Tax=Ilyobacter polytropus TaxID=167642 RepID=UPI0002E31AE4|nr:hypothetical protein [Ilyobacter polytropus]
MSMAKEKRDSLLTIPYQSSIDFPITVSAVPTATSTVPNIVSPPYSEYSLLSIQ